MLLRFFSFLVVQRFQHKKRLLLLLFVCAFLSEAHTKTLAIKGKVFNKNTQKGLSNIQILIQGNDNPTLTELYTDASGLFQYVSTDNQILKLSAVYKQDTFYRLIIHTAKLRKDTLFLIPYHNPELEEVVIHSVKKSTIKQEADKFVFTPSEDLKSGNSIVDLFKNTPMLSYNEVGTEGTPEVSIIGKSNTEIFIDGRRTFLTTDAILTMLSGQDAQNIERIEVITNPRAGTDVTQGSGIINIVMKSKVPSGWMGSVRFSDRQNTFNSPDLGGSIQYQSKKLVFNTDIMVGRRSALFSNTTENTFLSQKITQSNTIRTPHHTIIRGGIRLHLTYHISDKQTISFGIGGFHNRRKNNGINRNFFTAQDNIDKKDSSYSVENNQGRILSAGGGNFEYVLKIGKKGSLFKIDGNFNFFQNITATNLTTKRGIGEAPPTTLIENILQTTPLSSIGFRASLLYSHIFNDKHSIDIGFRTLQSQTDNRYVFATDVNGIWNINENRSNHFIYNEPSYIGFLSYNANWSKVIQTIIGFNLQRSFQKGMASTQKFTRDYLFFLPTISILYNISKNHQLGFAFIRNAQSPSFQDLNPFVIQQSNNTYTAGNQNLKVPSHYEGSVAYTFFQNYTVTLRYSLNKDPYTQVTVYNPNEDGHRIVQTPFNYGYYQGGYLITSASQTFFKGYWQIQGTANAQYTYYKGVIPNFRIDKGGWGGFINIANTISISKPYLKNKWIGSINFRNAFPSFQIYGLNSRGPNLGIGVKKIYNKWTFSLFVNDITRSNTMISTTLVNGLQRKSISYRDQQSATLTITYRFGNIIQNTKGRNNGKRKEMNKKATEENFQNNDDDTLPLPSEM